MFDKLIDPKLMAGLKEFLKYAAQKINEFSESQKRSEQLQGDILEELKKLNKKGGI